MAAFQEPLAFLAVVRVRDQGVLATYFDKNSLNEEKTSFERELKSLLERATSVAPGWKQRAECEGCEGFLYAFADLTALCVLAVGIRDKQYPERVALNCLREFADKVFTAQGTEILEQARPGALSTPLRKTMQDLMKQYNDVGKQDTTAKVQGQVDNLKGIMQDNVKQILETHVTLESLQNSSESMSSQANQFLRQSVDLRRQVQYRNLKLKIIMGVCISSLVVYFAMPFIPD